MLRRLLHKKYIHFHLSSVFLLVALVAIVIGSILASRQISLLIQQIFESSAIEKLNVYHNSVGSFVNMFFDDALKKITYFAHSRDVTSLLEINDKKKIYDELANFQGSNPEYYGVFIFDSKGNMITGKLRSEHVASDQVGNNFSYRDYFRKVLETTKPYQSDMYSNMRGKQVVAFSAPILDAKSSVRYVLVGSIELEDIAEYFNESTQASGFSFILTDQNGTLLLDTKNPTNHGYDISTVEPAIRGVTNGGPGSVEQEMNFSGDQVFAQSSRIKNSDKLILATFLPKKDVYVQNEELQLEYKRLFFGTMIMLFSFWSITTFIVRRYCHRDI